jgi:hypothetical protein
MTTCAKREDPIADRKVAKDADEDLARQLSNPTRSLEVK